MTTLTITEESYLLLLRFGFSLNSIQRVRWVHRGFGLQPIHYQPDSIHEVDADVIGSPLYW